MRRSPPSTLTRAALLLALAGCGFEPKAVELHFTLNPASVKDLTDAPEQQHQLATIVAQQFGTPTEPRYALSPEPRKTLESAEAGSIAARPTLAQSAELYRTQCLHCHGVEGGGDGPTSATLDPKPRDFRKGIFKFTAVKDKARPRREDLHEILERGVYGTGMPSFLRLSKTEREGLVDYTRFLAIRGEVESLLVASWKEDEKLDDEVVAEALDTVWERWRKAREKVIAFDGEIPRDTPELRARGRAIYVDAKRGNCAACHGETGMGDGPVAYKTDARGRKTPAYLDDWGFEILPRNLRTGIFRGGSRPIDIYRRIYAGINGGPMPGIGETKGADGKPLLTSEDLWGLVHYVRSLSERAD